MNKAYQIFKSNTTGAVLALVNAILFIFARLDGVDSWIQWYLAITTLMCLGFVTYNVSKENKERCLKCGYPLILRKNDDPNDPVYEEEMYEDDNDGLCGNCDCNDRISREAIARS